MIAGAVLDRGAVTATAATRVAGRAPNDLDRSRLGRYLNLPPIGSGNHRRLTHRQVATACVVGEFIAGELAPHGGSWNPDRAYWIGEILLGEGDWGDYLCLHEDGFRMVDHPEDVVEFIKERRGGLTTVVRLAEFHQRAVAA